jgi:hypothetical protein
MIFSAPFWSPPPIEKENGRRQRKTVCVLRTDTKWNELATYFWRAATIPLMRRHLSPGSCRCRWLHCTGCEYILRSIQFKFKKKNFNQFDSTHPQFETNLTPKIKQKKIYFFFFENKMAGSLPARVCVWKKMGSIPPKQHFLLFVFYFSFCVCLVSWLLLLDRLGFLPKTCYVHYWRSTNVLIHHGLNI